MQDPRPPKAPVNGKKRNVPPKPFEGSDENLRELCLRNPDRGWRCLEARYGYIIRWKISRFREFSTEDAQDVYQNISFHLSKDRFRVLQKWDPNKSSLGLYLAVVTSNQCRDYLRSSFYRDTRRLRHLGFGQDDETCLPELVSTNGPSPADYTRRKEIEDRIQDCIEKWYTSGDLKLRDLLLLKGRIQDGTRFKDLAKVLGMKAVAAMKQASRLKTELRARLKREGIDPSVL